MTMDDVENGNEGDGFPQRTAERNHQNGARIMNRSLRHLDRSLALVGLLSNWPLSKSCLGATLLVYHMIVWLYVWGYFFWRFTSYRIGLQLRGDLPRGIALAVLASVHLIFLQTGVVVYVSSKLAANRSSLISLWSKYRTEYTNDWVQPMERRCLKIVVGIWVCVVANTVFLVGLYKSTEALQHFFEMWIVLSTLEEVPGHQNRVYLTIAFCVLCVFLMAAIVFGMKGMLILFTLEITADFKQLNTDFAKSLNGGKTVSQDFHIYPRRHRILSELALRIDSIFSALILMMYLCGIVIMSLTLYTSICQHPFQTIDWFFTVTIPVLSYYLALMMFFAFLGARLQDAVYKSRNILYTINFRGLSQCSKNFALEYISFLTRLNNTEIGLTAWRLFQVNRRSLKMLFAMVITYTVVLLKLGAGGGIEDLTATFLVGSANTTWLLTNSSV